MPRSRAPLIPMTLITPLLDALRQKIARGEQLGESRPIERAVLDHGHEYIGIERPKGYRHQRARKACYTNAANLALDGRGTYVEGFVCPTDLDVVVVFQHAWITLDDVHAIDTTLPDAPGHLYFGIPFTNEIVAHAILRRESFGLLFLLEEHPDLVPDFAALLKLRHRDG
jgi:hypothetical protein